MTADAKLRISAENRASSSIKDVARDLEHLNRRAELMAKIFRGGAVVGAAVAFTRLADAAESTAKQFGDASASLEDFNAQLDSAIERAKRFGAAIANEALGSLGFGGAAREIEELERRLRNLQQQESRLGDEGVLDRILYGPGGRGRKLAAEISTLEERIRNLRLVEAQIERSGLAEIAGPKLDMLSPAGKASGGTAKSKEEERLRAEQKAFEEWVAAYDVQQQKVAKNYEELARQQQLVTDTATLSAGIIEESAQRAEFAFNGALESIGQTSVYADQAARDMQTAFSAFLFDPFENGVRGMVKGFVDAIRQMVAAAAAAKFFEFLGGTALGNLLPFGGARAAGGPVSPGRAFLVGERGPEWFVPRSSGTIVPNGAGALAVTYHIDARGADADRILAIMPGLLRQTEERTIARVQDMQQRGRLR